jgi:hypothetical protein
VKNESEGRIRIAKSERFYGQERKEKLQKEEVPKTQAQ